jgi:translation elongation factor EF-Tu-like GTPase
MELLVTFIPPDEGGRAHLPDLEGGMYRPHLVVQGRPEDEYLGVQFIGCKSYQSFGNGIHAEVRLVYEAVDYSALKVGASFVIKEGGREVGYGCVEKL